MLYFLYGEDNYSVTQRAQEIERGFIERQKSDFNLTKLDGEKLTAGRFLEVASTPPFLGDSRLILIKNFLLSSIDKEEKSKVADLLEKIPEENSVLFAEEGNPDQRQALFKRLLKQAKVEHFPKPSLQTLPAWIKKRVAALGGEIESEAVSKLALFVGPDLWQLQSEIEKLILLSQTQKAPIRGEDVAKMVPPNNAYKIFDLLDAVAEKNLKKSLLVYNSFLQAGEDNLMILNMIIYQLRNMLVVEDFLKNGKSEREIAGLASLHPYVASKLAASLKKFRQKEVERNFRQLALYDWKIKSGAIEPESALVWLVAQFCAR